jgi:hypothetical protein
MGLYPGEGNFFSCSRRTVVLTLNKELLTKVVCYSKIYYPTSLCVPIASGASVDSTSQVRFSAVLLSSIVGNYKVRF